MTDAQLAEMCEWLRSINDHLAAKLIAERDAAVADLKCANHRESLLSQSLITANKQLQRDKSELEATIAAYREALSNCSMCSGTGQMKGIHKDCDTGVCSEFFEDCLACAPFRIVLQSLIPARRIADE